mmetsp:Transcript_29728/g.85530  ORF Transcript_29728/g.85530 Transcript_29728/m.85530 type:complete len:523 (+) Transcript_29728:88-1656(+)
MMRLAGKWKFAAVVVVLATVAIFTFDFTMISSTPNTTIMPRNVTLADAVQMSTTDVALVPGELPSYTGWARPEATLASFFSIVSISSHQPRVGEEFTIGLWCHQNEDCSKGSSLFYLRAYGPSVIPGIIDRQSRGQYKASFTFPDPGHYTVEVVLSFSDPPPIESFPLSSEMMEPPYEGYLLPGFPLQVTIEKDDGGMRPVSDSAPLCTSDQLTETSPDSAAKKARWKVTSKSSAPNHTPTSTMITEAGYLRNVNSLGVTMDYQYLSGCKLIPESLFARSSGNSHPFAKCHESVHIIFVGDSVVRVQSEMFKKWTEHLPNIKSSYITLYGGYRRVNAIDETFIPHLEDIKRRAAGDRKVILFNSGLHDVHRLCGNEWKDDRREYLDTGTLDSGHFSCIAEYRALMEDFASVINGFEADLKVFQSTTAAWPKWGNYGIEWPTGGQGMPVATELVSYFNEVAFDTLLSKFPNIKLVDGYWITYSRPDNREVGQIGNKLSHPGLEVQSAMTRIWCMVLLEQLCSK